MRGEQNAENFKIVEEPEESSEKVGAEIMSNCTPSCRHKSVKYERSGRIQRECQPAGGLSARCQQIRSRKEMTIKIYGAALSGRTARVLAVLFEKDVTDFELVPVTNALRGPELLPVVMNDFDSPGGGGAAGGGVFSKPPQELLELLKKQPFGQPPVLKDGPLTLFESRAIARYVAEKFEGQGTALFGRTPAEKALVEQWLEIEGQKFNPPIAVISRETIQKKVSKGGRPYQTTIEGNIVKLGKVLDVYDRHLATSKYLAGDFFSFADLCHLPYIEHLISRSKRGEVIYDRPHVKAWWEEISARPAWKKVLALMLKEFNALCSR